MKKKTFIKKKSWYVYMIHCSDDSYYTGITTDVERRFKQHKNKQGAKYFYGREPDKVVFVEPAYNRSDASKREIEIKKLTRADKLNLIELT